MLTEKMIKLLNGMYKKDMSKDIVWVKSAFHDIMAGGNAYRDKMFKYYGVYE